MIIIFGLSGATGTDIDELKGGFAFAALLYLSRSV